MPHTLLLAISRTRCSALFDLFNELAGPSLESTEAQESNTAVVFFDGGGA